MSSEPTPTPFILELQDAVLPPVPGAAPLTCTLAVRAGETVLAIVNGGALAHAVADLCAGLTTPAEGTARMLGHDWADLDPMHADALRGGIGWWTGRGLFPPHMSIAEAVLMPAAYHTRQPLEDMATDAGRLARRFGLPGLPTAWPGDMDAETLARAAGVQAFLPTPRLALLVLTEPPPETILAPVLACVAEVRSRGGGALILARDGQAAGLAAATATRCLYARAGRLAEASPADMEALS